MFSLTASDRFYLYPYPTDMRKSFYTFGGIVTNQMGIDFQEGKTVSYETLWSDLVLMVQSIDAQKVNHRKRWIPEKKNTTSKSK